MAKITLGGNPADTIGELPRIGSKAPDFTLTTTQLEDTTLSAFGNTKKLLNIFPSVNTGVCSAAVRKFNEEAGSLENVQVLCISKDLPFSQEQFCAAEGLENVTMLSDFKTGQFGKDYNLTIAKSKFQGLLSRVVMVLDENNTILYTEQVPEIGQEPDYEKAINALK
jgi:thiol peroxidase